MSYLNTREAREAFYRRWKALAAARSLTALDVLLRSRLKGETSVTVALPLPTNPVKLANGGFYNSAAYLCAQYFRQGGRWTAGPQPMPAAEWLARWADPTNPESAPFGLTLAELKQVMAETVRPTV